MFDQRDSLDHCDRYYGRYGLFATLPLRAAVLESQIYDLEDFIASFEYSGKDHSHDLSLSEFINSLTYDDKDYFTVEETRFLLKIIHACDRLTDEQLEADRKALSREARQGKNMLKSHAKILLKAWRFWKLRYNDKYEEWTQKFADADQADVRRRRIQNGVIGGNDGNGNVEDEGYQSGPDSDSEDEYWM